MIAVRYAAVVKESKGGYDWRRGEKQNRGTSRRIFLCACSRDIVDYDMKKFKVGRAQVYDDLHLTQILMGNQQQASKEFMRWKIYRDLEEDLRMARQRSDLRAVASIEKNRIMNNRTDKDDEPELEFDKIVPQQFKMTDDPTVIGIQKVPGLRDRIRKLEKKYGDTKIEDAEYEEIKEEHDGNGTGT